MYLNPKSILYILLPLIIFQNCSSVNNLKLNSLDEIIKTQDSSTQTEEQLNLKSFLITNTHRYSPTMYSGWGPHLGRLLRANDNSLWFVGDTGNDVNHNPRLNYFKYFDNEWRLVSSQPLLGYVQQNVASVSDGEVIFSYGVDIRENRIVECRYKVLDPTDQSCKYLNFSTGISVNYIGATISKTGKKFVWFTNVSSSAGRWSYTYSNGEDWSEPTSYALNGYSDFSYVYLRLSDDENQFEAIGSAAKGLGGSAVGYDALSISGTVGSRNVKIVNLKSNGLGMDLWVDQQGNTHGLLYPGAQYVFKELGGDFQVLESLDLSASSARFVENDQKLFLIIATSTGRIKIRSINKTQLSGPVAWSSAGVLENSNFFNLGSLTIFSESSMYQVSNPQRLNFAITGLNSQPQVFHISE